MKTVEVWVNRFAWSALLYAACLQLMTNPGVFLAALVVVVVLFLRAFSFPRDEGIRINFVWSALLHIAIAGFIVMNMANAAAIWRKQPDFASWLNVILPAQGYFLLVGAFCVIGDYVKDVWRAHAPPVVEEPEYVPNVETEV
jgi:ABC-type Na+ efflux pump permease subunit